MKRFSVHREDRTFFPKILYHFVGFFLNVSASDLDGGVKCTLSKFVGCTKTGGADDSFQG